MMLFEYFESFDINLEQAEKQARKAARLARVLTAQRLVEPDQMAVQVVKWARAVAAAQLVARGYYYHRGQWRKATYRPRDRRHPESVDLTVAPTDLRGRLEATIWKAHAGEVDALRELRSLAHQHPALWETIADLNQQAMTSWRQLTASQGASEEFLARQVSVYRAELLGRLGPHSSSPFAKAIVEAFLVALMTLTYAETIHETSGVDERLRQQRMRMAYRRLRSMWKCLKLVRKAEAQPAKSPRRISVPRIAQCQAG